MQKCDVESGIPGEPVKCSHQILLQLSLTHRIFDTPKIMIKQKQTLIWCIAYYTEIEQLIFYDSTVDKKFSLAWFAPKYIHFAEDVYDRKFVFRCNSC